MSEAPETIVTCETCGGEGNVLKAIMVYEHGCGFPHEDTVDEPCPDCHGHGIFVDEVVPDRPRVGVG